MEGTSTDGTRTKRPRFAGAACLLIIPLTVILLTFWIKAAQGPLWLATNHDPSYHYLLNSLMIAELKAPYHVDNPGTPLQVLGAAVIWVTHLLRGSSSVRLDVLQNPELYLSAIHGTVTCLYGAILFLVGLITFRTTKNVAIALAMQSPPLLAHKTLYLGAHVTPEPLLMAVGTLFCAAVLTYLWKPLDRNEKRRHFAFAIALGVLIGLGMAAKLTFAPLALMPLVVLPNWRSRLLYVLAAPITFFLVTLPALPNFARFASWYMKWATHMGAYGGGATGLFKSEHLRAIAPVMAQTRLLPLFLAGAVAVILWLWRRGRTGSLPMHYRRVQRGLLALIVAAAASALMLLKQPCTRYTVPLLSSLGLAVVLCFEATKLWPRNLRLLRTVLVFLLVAYVVATRTLAVNRWRTELPATTKQYLAVPEEINRRYADAAKVYFFRASSRAYALSVSSCRSGHRFADDLRTLYPKSYLWDIWTKRYMHFGAPVSLQAIAAQGPEVVFQGEPFDREDDPDIPVAPPPNAVLKIVFQGKLETIYKLAD